MEQSEISIHQVKVYRCLAQSPRWWTNKELAEKAGISLRNASLHTQRFVALGICDQAEVYPGHRFRLAPKADKRNGAYLLRLQQADAIFAEDV